MTLRRIVTGTLAGSALLGLSVVTGGVASATESHGEPAQSCTTTGTATDSPGVQSGNVVQVPVLNCTGDVASPDVDVDPQFGTPGPL